MSMKKIDHAAGLPAVSQAPLSITGLTRNRYFAGKVLTEHDLTTEQHYMREQVRLHTLHLHGWGIASGLNVSVTNDMRGIIVSPGMAIDRYGRQLVVNGLIAIELPSEHRPWWLTFTYTERETDPVPIPSGGDRVQNSHIEEGVRISYQKDNPWTPDKEDPSGEDYSIAIAKLEWKRTRWQIAARRPCPCLR
jgi:hypothetical protein